MLSRFVENAALESAAQELILQAHIMVNQKHLNALHLKALQMQSVEMFVLACFGVAGHIYKCFSPQQNKLALELPAICLSHQDEGIPLYAFPNS